MSSILDLVQFKGRQAEAATSSSGAIAVTAGAGSGKTRALAGRFLALLERGLPLRSLVAITFTEKAAREMRTRIRGYIGQWLAEAADSVDRTLWENAFSELDAARIGTIHSLCAQVLRAHPAEAGVDPAFDVLDENVAAVLKARAVESALAWALTDPSAARLFGPLTEYQVRQTVATLLEHRLDARPALDALGDDPLAAWSAGLCDWLDDHLAAPRWTSALDTLAALQACKEDDKLEIDRCALLAVWRETQAARAAGDWDACLNTLLALRGHVNTRGGAKANWDAGDLARAREAMGDLRDHFDGVLAPLLDKKRPPAWSLDCQAAALLPDLRRLFEQAVAIYQALKDESHALDFDGLESRAADLLAHHPGVRARWQSETHAVLVDEFQDTNERQRQIVYALAGFDEGRGAGGDKHNSLFIVGDAKQSIYRFRGADVTVFRRVQEDVAAANGKHVDLDLTFRAHRPLVETLNALLAPVLGGEDDPARPYQVPFAPLRAYRQSPRDGIAGPHVEFHLGVGQDAASGRRAAADALVARLLALHARENVTWKDVALLFRASSAFPVYEDALERAGVPFVTVAGRGFYDRPEVRDLLNALTAIADPGDDLSLAGLLRSPAFGLSDAALYLLRRGARPGGSRRSLWAALNRDLSSLLSPLDTERGRRAQETIDALNGRVGRVPVAALLKGFLDLTHYRAALHLAATAPGARRGGSGVRALRNVDKLLADAHRSGLVGVNEFLEYVQSLRDVGARESEAPTETTEGDGAVQLMTVHKAKGLEFPVVVIADAAHAGGGRAGALLIDREWGVLVDLQEGDCRAVLHRLAALRHAEMDKAESRRLLYVAATRTMEKLIVSAHVKVSTAKKDPGRLSMEGWLGWLGAVAGLDRVRLSPPSEPDPIPLDLDWDGPPLRCVVHPPSEPADAPSPPTTPDPRPARIAIPTSPLVAPLVGLADASSDEKTREREREPPPRVWRVVPCAKRPTGPAWVVGQLAHVALCRWRFPDRDDFDLFLYPYALEAGLTDPREIANTIDLVRRLLARFQAHPLYAEMNAAERHHELPFSLPAPDNAKESGADGAPRNGIIDVLYRTAPGGGWIVTEFKTDELKVGADLNAHIRQEKYDRQVEGYVEAVVQLLGERPRVLIVFLNADGEVQVVSPARQAT